MKVGDKVLTNHGQGVVVGWESFDLKGNSRELSTVDNGNRVAVKLDEGHSWCFNGLYYERASQLKVV